MSSGSNSVRFSGETSLGRDLFSGLHWCWKERGKDWLSEVWSVAWRSEGFGWSVYGRSPGNVDEKVTDLS